MANPAAMEAARLKGMLENLQVSDPEITHIVIYSKFVVAYLLQQEGPLPGWRKAQIEGPVYVVRRRVAPRYQLVVKNQHNTTDLLDGLHPDWELDCQKNYVFYKIEDPAERIRGLWFHDDSERQKIEEALERVLEELRSQPLEPQTEAAPRKASAAQDAVSQQVTQQVLAAERSTVPQNSHMDTLYAQFGLQMPQDQAASQEGVLVTPASLRRALHALADEDAFIYAVMQKLKEVQSEAPTI